LGLYPLQRYTLVVASAARHVADEIDRLHESGRGIAGFIAETCPSVGGQIVFPPGYLAEVYAHVRAAGGVTIADPDGYRLVLTSRSWPD